MTPTDLKFFVQTIPVTFITKPRLEFFKQFIEDKHVLHIGCSDHPFPFNPKTNLHANLFPHTKTLDGYDTNLQGELIPWSTNLYSKPKDLENLSWDTILVPETIEHVDNVKEFCEFLDSLLATQILITAPNALYKNISYENHKTDDIFQEVIHPDHKCWYSPYTLTNVAKSYFKNFQYKQTFLLEKHSQVAVLLTK